MTSIIKASVNDTNLLTNLGKTTFIEAHGRSASEEIINEYISKRFTNRAIEEELYDSNNIFHIIYFNQTAVGYSKIIFNSQQTNISIKNITKLERIYILESYHGLKLGLKLFKFNLNESIKNNQNGIWLYVWTENHKAINFYKKMGFEIIGRHDFHITETHSNPNHQMLLTY
jgi:ribosomal protein S18 acetylase RimI-like enzyme